VQRLAATVSSGYSGSCWGHPFDWEARYAAIPAGTPTIVNATLKGSRTLAQAYRLGGASELLDVAARAVRFVAVCEFGDAEAATIEAERSLARLALPNSSFALQSPGTRTVQTRLLRWSAAWLYCAPSKLLLQITRWRIRAIDCTASVTGQRATEPRWQMPMMRAGR
jgi:hypothetical protein